MNLAFDQAVAYARKVSEMLKYPEVTVEPSYIQSASPDPADDIPCFYMQTDLAIYQQEGEWHVDGATYYGGSHDEPPSSDVDEKVFSHPDPIKAIHWAATAYLQEALDNCAIDYGMELEHEREKAHPAPAEYDAFA